MKAGSRVSMPGCSRPKGGNVNTKSNAAPRQVGKDRRLLP